MSQWEVIYTEQAEEDLRGIYQYIAFELKEEQTAENMYYTIADTIDKLDSNPFVYAPYPKEPWYSMGLRKIPIKNYLCFYLPTEENMSVNILRIIYGKRDIEPLLQEIEW
ncbi:MAG: type II toxin-antitoxin system RelE/ParE family toxin [Eubacteriales bacterium]